MERDFYRTETHEAGHCLACWSCGVRVAVVKLGAGDASVLPDVEVNDPFERWFIREAGSAAEFASLGDSGGLSLADVVYSDAPQTRSQGRLWRRRLDMWVWDELHIIEHLALRLAERLTWHPPHLAALVWADDWFRDFRPLYKRPEPAAAPARSPSKKYGGDLNSIIADVMGALQPGNAMTATRIGGMF